MRPVGIDHDRKTLPTDKTMRIFLHDYGRYPFIVELAQQLTKYGHSVQFAYSGQDTPRTAIAPSQGADSPVCYVAIQGARPLSKANLIKRRRAEIEHGKLVVDRLLAFGPDVVISANAPLDAQSAIAAWCSRHSKPFIYWVQDLLGVGIANILSRKIGLAGRFIGARYINLEARLLRSSDLVVAISDDFVPILCSYGVRREKIEIVENWVPLSTEPLPARNNDWSERNGLNGKFCFLYAGTMGMKHNPSLIYNLANAFRKCEDVAVVVVAEGVAASWLLEKKASENVQNLLILPFQPFADLPNVLATGDVLMALLDTSAGIFSVPSKVLTYLSAERPILLSAPAENQISRVVSHSGSGLVTSPADSKSFVCAGRQLYNDPQLRIRLAKSGRSYAEENFDITKIGAKFNQLFEHLIADHN